MKRRYKIEKGGILMMKSMRRLLAEKRKFRTASDFDLLLKKNWISDVEDCELLSTLISRCIKE